MLNELHNKNETSNKSLEFDIQRYLDVKILDSNLYEQEFGMKDAIPISLNLESFIFIKTSCIHNILHNFKLPVKTEIKWKIKGGIAKGAFKIGNGMDAEYFPRDSGDSVIFYPQLQNDNSKNQNYKKICVELTVKQLGSRIFKDQECQFVVNINILTAKKFAKRTFRAKMFISKLEDESNNSNNDKVDNHISKHIIINSDDLKSTAISKLERKEKEVEDKNQISFKSVNNCKICNLSIIIKNKTTTTTSHPFSIKSLKSYVITSDIIKVSAESKTKTSMTNNISPIILSGSTNKKYLIDSMQIQPRIFWKSNIGEFVYGNLGEDSIYYTPGESELSKSPITINLYFHYDHNVEDLREAILSDSKKVWMIRQPPLRLF